MEDINNFQWDNKTDSFKDLLKMIRKIKAEIPKSECAETIM